MGGYNKVSPFLTALQGAQPPYQLLVANFLKPHTPEFGTTGSNPIRSRSGFRFQNTSLLSFNANGAGASSTVVATLTGSLNTGAPFTHQTGAVTVADNDFSTGRAEVYIDKYILVADEDFLVGGTTALTATALALAISRLNGYSGTFAAASVVNVVGPLGSQNRTWRTKVYGTIGNFSTITPENGLLTYGDPQRGGNVILPA